MSGKAAVFRAGLLRVGPALINEFIGIVPGNPSSFGEDLAGELYVTSFDGKVYKLLPAINIDADARN